ncbi:hypothetical protein AB7M29_003387 [Pseudomonas sp. F-14 TE3623]
MSGEIKMWERACSRMRCVIQHPCQLNNRFREQARSHMDLCQFWDRVCRLLKAGRVEFIPAQTYTRRSASPVDGPALTPYPRACHDSFVIGFDGLYFSYDAHSLSLLEHFCARCISFMATVRGAPSGAPVFVRAGPSTHAQLPPNFV